MPLWSGLGRGSGGYWSAATSDGANKPEDPPLFSSGQAAAGNGCIPDVSKAAAKPDADELYYVGEEHVRCVLKWENVDGQQLDVSLRAELAIADGLVIGSVHGQLRDHAQNVDNQFQECGVKHEHEALKEELSLELKLLTPNPVVDLVFVTAGVHGGQLCLGDIPRIDVSLLTGGLCDLSHILASTELSKDTTARSETRVLIAIFARAPSGGWRVAWFRAPAPGDERGGLSEEAAIALSKRMLDGVREGRVGANGQPEEVDILIAAGDIAGAIKKQQAVLQRLADDDTCSSTFEREYNRLEELQRMMSGGASSSSGEARVQISDAARSEQNITQAQIESVDEEGYQSIVAVRDTKAMLVFIKRVMERYNGGLREPLLEAIAAQHSCEKEMHNWERLLEDLYCSTGSSSSSCAPPATTDPEESRRRTAAASNQAIAETCDVFLVGTPGQACEDAKSQAPGNVAVKPDPVQFHAQVLQDLLRKRRSDVAAAMQAAQKLLDAACGSSFSCIPRLFGSRSYGTELPSSDVDIVAFIDCDKRVQKNINRKFISNARENPLCTRVTNAATYKSTVTMHLACHAVDITMTGLPTHCVGGAHVAITNR